jgi:triphosphoribosyl-dephospho-CoA synthase
LEWSDQPPAQGTGAPDAIRQQQFLAACELDVTALKPGNVRIGIRAHGMTADDFRRSAQACAPALSRAGASVGQRVLEAIRSTQRVVRCNTNLGIVLLAAPLFRAAEAGGPLRSTLVHQLTELNREDAQQVYEAIRLARPGGLGTSDRYDVSSEPHVTLLEAMREAQQRDSIARQYAQGYRDVFDLGLAQWSHALGRFEDELWAATHLYLVYLSTWPDSLIERKFGIPTAQAVSEQARELHSQLSSYSDLDGIKERLLSWDEALRQAGLNPGTSADLTVATVFAAKLTAAV